MNLSHEEKRRELETRLGKFSQMTKALIAHQQLFIQVNSSQYIPLIFEFSSIESHH